MIRIREPWYIHTNPNERKENIDETILSFDGHFGFAIFATAGYGCSGERAAASINLLDHGDRTQAHVYSAQFGKPIQKGKGY